MVLFLVQRSDFLQFFRYPLEVFSGRPDLNLPPQSLELFFNLTTKIFLPFQIAPEFRALEESLFKLLGVSAVGKGLPHGNFRDLEDLHVSLKGCHVSLCIRPLIKFTFQRIFQRLNFQALRRELGICAVSRSLDVCNASC